MSFWLCFHIGMLITVFSHWSTNIRLANFSLFGMKWLAYSCARTINGKARTVLVVLIVCLHWNANKEIVLLKTSTWQEEESKIDSSCFCHDNYQRIMSLFNLSCKLNWHFCVNIVRLIEYFWTSQLFILSSNNSRLHGLSCTISRLFGCHVAILAHVLIKSCQVTVTW